MKIFVHVGAHKTATTFLQNNMRSNVAAVENEGVLFVDKKSESAAKIFKKYNALLAARKKRNIGELSNTLAQLIKPALDRRDYQCIFISEENLLGQMLSARHGFYPDAAAAAEAINGLNQYGEVNIILTVRRQDTYIESCYSFRKIRENSNSTASIYDFISKIDLNSLSWQPIVQSFIDVFSKEKCKFLPYELIKEDAAKFAADIFADFIDPSVLSINTKPSNARISNKGLRILNLLDNSSINITEKERYDLGQAIHQVFRDASYKRSPFMHEYFREEIIKKYEKDNLELFNQYMPSINPLMYTLQHYLQNESLLIK